MGIYRHAGTPETPEFSLVLVLSIGAVLFLCIFTAFFSELIKKADSTEA